MIALFVASRDAGSVGPTRRDEARFLAREKAREAGYEDGWRDGAEAEGPIDDGAWGERAATTAATVYPEIAGSPVALAAYVAAYEEAARDASSEE
jgi:hypothetical protein